jgi:hypothetical protein
MRWTLMLLLSFGCVAGGQMGDPVVSVSPSRAEAGAAVTVVASGFPPDSEVTISAGAAASQQTVLAQARTDNDGRVESSVLLPADAGEEVVIIVSSADDRVRATSGIVTVARADERPSGSITITGRVTDEGVECLAVRGDDGRLYTLAGGDRDKLRTGARVRITGTIAEMSFCMQGTTINATAVELLE